MALPKPSKKRPLGTRVKVHRARKHGGRVSAWIVECERCGRIHGADDDGKPIVKMGIELATKVAASHGRLEHNGFAHVAVRNG